MGKFIAIMGGIALSSFLFGFSANAQTGVSSTASSTSPESGIGRDVSVVNKEAESQIKVLRAELEQKIKALREEYNAKIKAIRGAAQMKVKAIQGAKKEQQLKAKEEAQRKLNDLKTQKTKVRDEAQKKLEELKQQLRNRKPLPAAQGTSTTQ